MSNSELATSYAALILANDGADITADKLQSLIKVAGDDRADPAASNIFAKALEGKDVKDLLLDTDGKNDAATVLSARIRSTSILPGFDETVGAFILAFLGARVPPSKEKIEVILDSVAIKPDDDLDERLHQLLGISLDKLLTTYLIKPLNLRTNSPCHARPVLSCCNKNPLLGAIGLSCFATLTGTLIAGPSAVVTSCPQPRMLSCCKSAIPILGIASECLPL